MEELRAYVTRFVALTEAEWFAFSSLFSERALEKGTYFAREGRVEKEMGFLLHGVMRAFYRDVSGTEYNKFFFTENEFTGAYTSLVTRQPNYINIEALTPCTLLVAPYAGMQALYQEHRGIETLARMLAESFYCYKQRREIQLVLMDAGQRYKLFREEYPALENSIPQYHIASYLGITPTPLSRIRARKEA